MVFWHHILLFLLFVKIGAVSFGGAYSIWALVQNEFVDGRGIFGLGAFGPLASEKMYQYMEVGQLTPGPNINGVLLVGEHYLGLPGIFIVLLGLLLPSVIAIIALYHINQRFGLNEGFRWFKKGALAAVIGILLFFLFKLGGKIPQSHWHLTALFILQALVVLYFIHSRRANVILVTFLSGMVTWGYTYFL